MVAEFDFEAKEGDELRLWKVTSIISRRQKERKLVERKL